MIVCLCKSVSDREIKTAIGEGHTTVKALARRCAAGTGNNCGGCRQTLRSMLVQHTPPATCRPEEPTFDLASGDSNG